MDVPTEFRVAVYHPHDPKHLSQRSFIERDGRVPIVYDVDTYDSKGSRRFGGGLPPPPQLCGWAKLFERDEKLWAEVEWTIYGIEVGRQVGWNISPAYERADGSGMATRVIELVLTIRPMFRTLTVPAECWGCGHKDSVLSTKEPVGLCPTCWKEFSEDKYRAERMMNRRKLEEYRRALVDEQVRKGRG